MKKTVTFADGQFGKKMALVKYIIGPRRKQGREAGGQLTKRWWIRTGFLQQGRLRIAPGDLHFYWDTGLRHACPGHGHAKTCPTVCHPMDCSPPRSSVHGILQARILEWGSSQPRDSTRISCISCIGRQILYHSATWEALKTPFPLLQTSLQESGDLCIPFMCKYQHNSLLVLSTLLRARSREKLQKKKKKTQKIVLMIYFLLTNPWTFAPNTATE